MDISNTDPQCLRLEFHWDVSRGLHRRRLRVDVVFDPRALRRPFNSLLCRGGSSIQTTRRWRLVIRDGGFRCHRNDGEYHTGIVLFTGIQNMLIGVCPNPDKLYQGSNCPVATANTNCFMAIPIASLPFEVEQSSELVPIFRQAFGCGAWFDRKKIFYSIQFEEPTCLTAVVQSTRTTHYRGLQVSVFEAVSANCTSITCVKEGYPYHSEQEGFSSMVSFKAVAQKLYYLIVMDEEVSNEIWLFERDVSTKRMRLF